MALVRDWVPEAELVFSETIQRITTVRGDLGDYPLLERVLNEYEIEAVFHLGAQTIVGIANRNPLSTFESNVRGTWQILEACRRSPTVGRIVVASSDKAYGEHSILPYEENTPLAGRHPYDVSKSCADLIAQAYRSTFGMRVCVTRCGNLYGGGDLNFNRIVPGTIRAALLGQRPVIRSDGSPIRDYFFVEDAVMAYIILAERIGAGGEPGDAFNFSNESQVSVLDLVHLILRLMGREDLRPDVLNTATGEIQNQYLSASRAREVLGWRPLFSLEEGLKKTIEWYREYLLRGGT